MDNRGTRVGLAAAAVGFALTFSLLLRIDSYQQLQTWVRGSIVVDLGTASVVWYVSGMCPARDIQTTLNVLAGQCFCKGEDSGV